MPTWLSLFLILGIVFGKEFDLSPPILFSISILSLIGQAFFLRKSHKKIRRNNFFLLFSVSSFFIIGLNSYTIHQVENQNRHYKKSKLLTDSSFVLLEIEKELKPARNYHKYTAFVFQIDDRPTRGKVLMFVSSENDSLAPGDRFLTKSKLIPIPPPLNPNDFDYRKYMQNEQISDQVFINDNNSVTLKPNRNLAKRAFTIRAQISKSLQKKSFQTSLVPLVQTLFLGQRQDLSQAVFNEFRRAGVVHLLAISGLHISILIGFLFMVFKPLTRLRNGKKIQLFLVLFMLWSYVFLVGYTASVVRAGTMFTAISVGLYSKKTIDVQSSLITSLFLLLLFNPNFIWQVGFLMSYLAVFFILGFFPLLSIKTKFKIIDYFVGLILVTIIAQMGVLPLSLYYFHEASPLFLVSGLLLLPSIGVILSIGFLTIFLSVFNLAPVFLVKLFSFSLGIFYESVHLIASLKTFQMDAIYLTKQTVILMYLALFSFFAYLKHRHAIGLLMALTCVIMIQFHLIHVKWDTGRKNQFVVFHQYKETVLIHQKGDKAITYRSNPEKEENSTVQNFMNANKIRELEKETLKPCILEIDDQSLLVVTKNFHFEKLPCKPEFLLMSNSPKVNFEKLVDHFQPKTILVDGSNYTYLIKKWEITARSKGIVFHYTGDKGAFVYRH